ncbi:conserved hypothetical protein [Hyphomonas neptunium ATCC 15444]|nr:conserved hypothetical protein [Hyphomonas neptunium ATCC 15444]
MKGQARFLFIDRLNGHYTKETPMLGWALTFFILAIIAALLGFGGIAGAAASIAKILFFVFLALLVITFVARALRGRSIT